MSMSDARLKTLKIDSPFVYFRSRASIIKRSLINRRAKVSSWIAQLASLLMRRPKRLCSSCTAMPNPARRPSIARSTQSSTSECLEMMWNAFNSVHFKTYLLDELPRVLCTLATSNGVILVTLTRPRFS